MNERSRRGCVTCLQQHKKCDEQQPTCARCSRLQLDCDYNRSVRWFNGAKLSRTKRRDRLRHEFDSADRSSGSAATEALPSRQTCTTPAERSPATEHSANGSASYDALTWMDGYVEEETATNQNDPLTPRSYIATLSEEMQAIFGQSESATSEFEHLASELLGTERVGADQSASNPEKGDYDNHLTNSYDTGNDRNPLVSKSSPQAPQRALNRDSTTVQQPSNPSTDELSLCAACPFDADFRQMIFQDNGRYMAYMYFIRSVALILPGCGGVRNGYRQIAASAMSSPMLLDTVVSVATVYMHLRGSAPASLALDRQSQALASLRRNLNTLSASSASTTPVEMECLKRDILATILLQITVEIANGTSFIRTHISHAYQLFQDLGYDQGPPISSLGQVLVQRMTYIDVLSSIFWRRRPNLPMSFWFFTHGEVQPCDGTPTFQETTGCPLWVISALARISHLIADADNRAPNEVIMSLAYQLDADLAISYRFYETPTPTAIENEEHKCLHVVGQCYYWSATILLQRRVFRDAPTSQRVQYSLRRLMDLLDSLPIGCGPDSQLSLALYAAALAAVIEDDRDAIRSKSLRLSEHYPMRTRDALTATFAAMWADMDSTHAPDSVGGDSQKGLTRDLMKEKTLFIC